MLDSCAFPAFHYVYVAKTPTSLDAVSQPRAKPSVAPVMIPVMMLLVASSLGG
jgi:hypothetical protein